jgi:hypothetical protein
MRVSEEGAAPASVESIRAAERMTSARDRAIASKAGPILFFVSASAPEISNSRAIARSATVAHREDARDLSRSHSVPGEWQSRVEFIWRLFSQSL